MTHEEMMAKATPIENAAPASQQTVTSIVTLADGSKPEDAVRWFDPVKKRWIYQGVIGGKIYRLRPNGDGTYKPC